MAQKAIEGVGPVPDEGLKTELDPLAPFRIKKCVKCGYDLHGRANASNCPECGLDISDGLLIPPVKGGFTLSAWMAVAALCLLVFIVTNKEHLFFALLWLAIGAAVSIVGWRDRPRYGLGASNLLVTTTCVARRERGSIRFRPIHELSQPIMRREGPTPFEVNGRPIFQWILSFPRMSFGPFTQFFATESQADALRDEVVRRMEAVGDDQPDNPSSE